MARVRVKASQKPKTIEVDYVKSVFIEAIKAHKEMTFDMQYDIGFQRGLEHGYYLFRSAAGEIKKE